MSCHVLDGAGEPLAAGEVVQDAKDPKAFRLAFDEALPPGQYTVSWRGMGRDGHVVRDDFTFSVAARCGRSGPAADRDPTRPAGRKPAIR